MSGGPAAAIRSSPHPPPPPALPLPSSAPWHLCFFKAGKGIGTPGTTRGSSLRRALTGQVPKAQGSLHTAALSPILSGRGYRLGELGCCSPGSASQDTDLLFIKGTLSLELDPNPSPTTHCCWTLERLPIAEPTSCPRGGQGAGERGASQALDGWNCAGSIFTLVASSGTVTPGSVTGSASWPEFLTWTSRRRGKGTTCHNPTPQRAGTGGV